MKIAQAVGRQALGKFAPKFAQLNDDVLFGEVWSGDVVTIPANVRHWHGAAKDGWLSHIAVECPGQDTRTEWCDLVTDEEYDKLG